MCMIIFFCGLASYGYAFQLVDINQANADQIALLPGVGKRLAQNIVAKRMQRRFSTLSDLSGISGMTDRKLAQIKDHLIFGARSKKIVAAKNIAIEEKKSLLSTQNIISIAALEEKVLLWQGLDHQHDHSLVSRVRKSAWLPTLSTHVDTDHDEVATKKSRQDPVQTRGNRELGFGVKLSFDLDKLIFNHEEIDVAKLMLTRQDKRNDILSQVRKHYFHYVKLASTLVSKNDVEVIAKLTSDLDEIKAALDSLSGGAFTSFLVHAS